MHWLWICANPMESSRSDQGYPDPRTSPNPAIRPTHQQPYLDLLFAEDEKVSNWVRLTLIISPRLAAMSSDGVSLRRHASSWVSQQEWSMDFDSSLGYPGEGPQSIWICLLPFWTFVLLAEGASLYLSPRGLIFLGE